MVVLSPKWLEMAGTLFRRSLQRRPVGAKPVSSVFDAQRLRRAGGGTQLGFGLRLWFVAQCSGGRGRSWGVLTGFRAGSGDDVARAMVFARAGTNLRGLG